SVHEGGQGVGGESLEPGGGDRCVHVRRAAGEGLEDARDPFLAEPARVRGREDLVETLDRRLERRPVRTDGYRGNVLHEEAYDERRRVAPGRECLEGVSEPTVDDLANELAIQPVLAPKPFHPGSGPLRERGLESLEPGGRDRD